MLYEWIKALHVISIIAWMAGLLYLPRLFVYHCQVVAGSEASETFKVMERRLLRAIMNPAMIASYVFGITMILLTPEWMKQGWLHAKLLFVLLLTASHMMMARWRREFAEDRNTRPQRFYRIANEVPTLLMIGIVIFVIVKPF
ncbi:protoporphyrinogen oxidase HemJ [Azospirillum sp. TSH100]|uniref:protoporphyrinogen oxidase HemJ n=1 Tax=Azospirillum sp. TSH100 TaxID=652764 RepID=UPI000D6446F4|nr:protoporphyrinogen oxidase HemJ [Azospirillum sp. TSH100]QCG87047.1 protoporphyrinogen oxidase HemJ [Azospirillum sp. TSH100]